MPCPTLAWQSQADWSNEQKQALLGLGAVGSALASNTGPPGAQGVLMPSQDPDPHLGHKRLCRPSHTCSSVRAAPTELIGRFENRA